MISKEQQNPLDELFGMARTEAPKVSYKETEKMFLKALAFGGIGLLTTKGIAYLLKLKFSVVMLSTAGIVATSVIVIQAVSPEAPKPDSEPLAAAVSQVESEPIEEPVLTEDTVSETVYFDDVKQMVLSEDETDKAEEPVADPEPAEEPEAPETPVVPNPIAPVRAIAVIQDGGDRGDLATNNPDLQLHVNYKSRNGTTQDIWINKETDCEEFRLKITEKTTEAELEQLKQKAIAAGIDFTYSVRFKKERIKSLNLSMSLNNPQNEKKTSQVNISSTDNFSVEVGWISENGKAIKFTSHRSNCCQVIHCGEALNIDQEQIEEAIERTEEAVEQLTLQLEQQFSEEQLDQLQNQLDDMEENLAIKAEKLEQFLSDTDWELKLNESSQNLENYINNVTSEINCIINTTEENLQNNEDFQNNILELENKLLEIEERILQQVHEELESIEEEESEEEDE